MRDPPATFPVVALVLALAVGVAFASLGTPLWSLVREGRADRLVILVEIAALCALGLGMAVAGVFLAHRAFTARRPGATPFRSALLRALPPVSAALAVLSLLVIARTDLGRPIPEGEGRGHLVESSDRRALPLTITGWFNPAGRPGEGETDQEQLRDGADAERGVAPLLMALGAVVLLVTGAAAWRWRGAGSASSRPGTEDDAADRMAGAVHGAVASTIDGMLTDPDPGTAIRGAYARLLEGLDTFGSGRRDHEGPMEHLRRVLTRLQVRPEPLQQLAALFEVARFSTRPLTARDRERALDALRAVAADLSADVAFDPGTGAQRAAGR